MAIMASAESAIDPLTERDHLTGELANLEKQFADRKVQEKEFQLLSKQLRERIQKAELQAYNLARTDESIARRLRLRNFNDPTIQQVISCFLSSGGKPLEPSFGPDRIPRYPIKAETGEMVTVERVVLQKMADIGMVTETLYERMVSCPKCGMPTNVYLRFKCAQCSSIDVTIDRMIEHLQCGTIHQENVFRVGRNLACPTCKKMLQDPTDYRVIGVVCSCKTCNAHFEDPVQSFYCRACKNDFSLSLGLVGDVFTYSVSNSVLNEARRFLGVDALTRILTENGYLVKSPGTMVVVGGHSKEIVFSLTAQKDTRLIAVDISQSDTEVEVEPVLELFVKMLEANPTVSIFGAIPVLSKRARDVAAMHNILVAEGPNPRELAKKVLEILGHA
jgi:hypothetical protein